MPFLRSTPGRFRPEALFHPRAVAILGADTAEGAPFLANLRAGGFTGPLHALPAGPAAIAGIAEAPDLALVCAPPGDLPAILAALGRRGTRCAIVTGDAPADLRALTLASGVRALGPRSFGLAVPAIGLNATAAHLPPRAGRLALVGQSSGLARAVLDWAEPNGVGFSHVVGIGANGDIGFSIVLDWLSRDASTGAILLDIRRIRDPRAFLSAARAAARLRPVVALHAGAASRDRAGADAFAAALRRSGVLPVATLEDLLAAAETLTRARPAAGEAPVIVATTAGPAQLAADALRASGLAPAHLAPETCRTLSLLSVTTTPQADFLLAPAEPPTRLAEIAAMLAGARETGGVLVLHTPAAPPDAQLRDDTALAAITASAAASRVPLLAAILGETTAAGHRRLLAEAGIPAFHSPEAAVRAFLHLVQHRRNRAAARELPASTVLRLAPDRAEVRRRFAAARAEGRLDLAQDEALAVLAAYGMPTIPGRVAMTVEDAVHAAALLGYPVVVKRRRLGPATDRPGADKPAEPALALDLRDPTRLRAAAQLLDSGDGIGLLVQRQAGRARELRIRVREDALLGPTIAFGQGGTASDLLDDLAIDLPPLNLTLAAALIARTRVAATLGALHDQQAADLAAIADALVRVSQLVVDFPEIAELDINPLFADGQGVLAADAAIRLRPRGAAPAHLAIPPYPGELATTLETGGETLVLRPIRPEDANAHIALFNRLSPEDVRYRFFSALRELSREQVARLTQVDYAREIAFIAVRPARTPGAEDETVGVARLVCETTLSENGPGEGEFAVLVQPDMKGRGVARRLMEMLIAWGRAQGLTAITGQVLADNRPMQVFIRALGFTLRRAPGEPDLLEARLPLDEAAPDGHTGGEIDGPSQDPPAAARPTQPKAP
ncbi:MAG: GNAT family N-acetyltransferase [Rhodospirillales bacterium]|nr:GNAT family N-acetyltransferase [Rhodospirillales bacterium]